MEKKLHQKLIHDSDAAEAVSLTRDVMELTKESTIKPAFAESFPKTLEYFKQQYRISKLHPNVILGLLSTAVELSKWHQHKLLCEQSQQHPLCISLSAIHSFLSYIKQKTIRFSLNQISRLTSILIAPSLYSRSDMTQSLPDDTIKEFQSILSCYFNSTNLNRISCWTKVLLNEELISLCHFVQVFPPDFCAFNNNAVDILMKEFLKRFDDLTSQSTNEQMLILISNLSVDTIEKLAEVLLVSVNKDTGKNLSKSFF